MKKNKSWILKTIMIIIITCISILFIKVIGNLNVLPNKYYYLFIGILILFNVIGSLCLIIKKKWTKIITAFIYVIIVVLSAFGIKYGNDTVKFLNNAFNNNTKEVTGYSVLIKKNSSYQNIKDIKEKNTGFLSSDPQSTEVLKTVEKIVKVTWKKNEDLYSLYETLINQENEAIIVDDAYISVLEEEYDNYWDSVRVLYTFDIETTIDKIDEEITSLEPFNVFISGSDSRKGTIYNKSRSDVNMVLTINPETKEILMTSIPRDYFVQVHGQTGLKDKLTHAGIYGLDVSRETVADLFNTDIDYAIKIGMPAVVELVDMVGGITINSDKEFNSFHMPGWVVLKGNNEMDGAKALAYARERYAYAIGDRHRIQNQQQVLEAVMKKIMTNKSILLKYDELLTNLSNLYRTNLPKEIITMLVKNQINDMSAWHFTSQWVSGSDASLPTHTAPNSKRYVMVPYEKDLKRARTKINEVLKNTNSTEKGES